MVKATGTPHHSHRRSVTPHQALKELQAMISEGRVEAGRVIAFVKDKAKRTIGRPELAPEQKRSALIQIRVTPAEMKAIERAAKKAGVSKTFFLRQVIAKSTG